MNDMEKIKLIVRLVEKLRSYGSFGKGNDKRILILV